MYMSDNSTKQVTHIVNYLYPLHNTITVVKLRRMSSVGDWERSGSILVPKRQ
jgi:hypothetical protein